MGFRKDSKHSFGIRILFRFLGVKGANAGYLETLLQQSLNQVVLVSSTIILSIDYSVKHGAFALFKDVPTVFSRFLYRFRYTVHWIILLLQGL